MVKHSVSCSSPLEHFFNGVRERDLFARAYFYEKEDEALAEWFDPLWTIPMVWWNGRVSYDSIGGKDRTKITNRVCGRNWRKEYQSQWYSTVGSRTKGINILCLCRRCLSTYRTKWHPLYAHIQSTNPRGLVYPSGGLRSRISLPRISRRRGSQILGSLKTIPTRYRRSPHESAWSSGGGSSCLSRSGYSR